MNLFKMKKQIAVITAGMLVVLACGSSDDDSGKVLRKVTVPFEVMFGGADATAPPLFQVQAIIRDQASLETYLETIGNPESQPVDFSHEVVIAYTTTPSQAVCPQTSTTILKVEKDVNNHITITLEQSADCLPLAINPYTGTWVIGIKVEAPVATVEVVLVSENSQ